MRLRAMTNAETVVLRQCCVLILHGRLEAILGVAASENDMMSDCQIGFRAPEVSLSLSLLIVAGKLTLALHVVRDGRHCLIEGGIMGGTNAR